MRNFQGIVFVSTRTYSQIFKSALVYLKCLHLIDSFFSQNLKNGKQYKSDANVAINFW